VITDNLIDGDTGAFIGQDPDRGIDFVPNVFSGTAHVTIQGNQVLDFVDEGIRINLIVDPDNGTVNALIGGSTAGQENVVSAISGDPAIYLEAAEGHTINATVTNNELDHGATEDSIQVTASDFLLGGQGGIVCLDASGNTDVGGAGAPGGPFDIDNFNFTNPGGSLSISQASTAALATDNGGVTVNTTPPITTGAGGCTQPAP